LNFENEIEYKILVTYVIAKVSGCNVIALFDAETDMKVVVDALKQANHLEEHTAYKIEQIEDKEMQLKQLRAELSAKDIHIAELDETIGTLNTSVNELTEESNKKTETINTQDKQLNTAWYVFGTKKELKEQRILADGKLMQSNFNKNYFTKIDIRVDKEIKLYTKSAKILTVHPADSYKLSQDASNQYVLRITNPDLFWSTSKYLVVLVK